MKRIPEFVLGALAAIALIALSATVTSIYPKNHYAERHTSENSSQKSAKDVTDERIAGYTEVLAWFTGVLAVATVALWWVTWRSGARQSREMQESISAAKRTAELAEKTIDAAEAPFLFPIIVAHGITGTEDGFVTEVAMGEMVQYEFENLGRTPAILLDVYSAPSFELGLPVPLSDLILHTGNLRTEFVGAGKRSKRHSFGLNRGLYDYFFGGKLGKQNNNILTLQIQVRYADLFGNEFVGRFCFAYAAVRNDWYCIGGSEYNYRRKVRWPPPLPAADIVKIALEQASKKEA